MPTDEYIKLLATNSKTKQHELILECLEKYKVMGIIELKTWQLKQFCKEKGIKVRRC